MITFFAPPSMWAAAFWPSVNTPVDSTTMSAPTSPQGISAGSLSAKVFISRSPTRRMLPSSSTSSGQMPWTVSRLKRSARLSIGIRSLTATIWTSSSLRSMAALAVSIPIRPNPFMPTLTATISPVCRLLWLLPVVPKSREINKLSGVRLQASGFRYLLKPGACGLMPLVGRQADEPSEAVVGGALGEAPDMRELRE